MSVESFSVYLRCLSIILFSWDCVYGNGSYEGKLAKPTNQPISGPYRKRLQMSKYSQQLVQRTALVLYEFVDNCRIFSAATLSKFTEMQAPLNSMYFREDMCRIELC